ncbi:MAG: hypothetical protein QGF67_09080 [Lentisphaeria bacterium]|jgi:hypothetical protein|nr:hypothetical protein [Lentisphaeria bacterium]
MSFPVNLDLPFAHLNLRFNPFGELEPQTRAELAVVSLEDLPRQLQQQRLAVEFVGPHGHGKSTHLLALHALFAEAPYLKLYPDSTPDFAGAPLLFVDSIEHLPRRRRQRLYRRAKTLALTTHDSLQPELERAGYTVCTRHVDSTDAATIAELVRRRIEHARRAPGPLPDVDAAGIDRLKARFGGNIRAIENCLYDIFQTLDRPRHVEV